MSETDEDENQRGFMVGDLVVRRRRPQVTMTVIGLGTTYAKVRFDGMTPPDVTSYVLYSQLRHLSPLEQLAVQAD